VLITETFTSVQGEGAAAGRPCTFVRLARCNLRCVWCDTKYSFTGGDERALDDVLADVRARGPRLVCVTGGEPLMQPEAVPLMQQLLDEGFEVLLETSGALPLDPVPAGVVKVMDLKCPGSGEEAANHWPNLRLLGVRDEVKFVVQDEVDYLWARDACRRHGLGGRPPRSGAPGVLLSPVHGALAPADLVAWMLRDGLEARLNLQVHKYVWGADARGV
jgi:7-carboxy-7-deazaguanine synthase